MPRSFHDFVPEGYLARFVADVVGTLDLGASTEDAYPGESGFPPHHPQMMVTMLTYATARQNWARSGRFRRAGSTRL